VADALLPEPADDPAGALLPAEPPAAELPAAELLPAELPAAELLAEPADDWLSTVLMAATLLACRAW
jgi:hypothetical protein